VPFYCAAPSSTLDTSLADGDAIPIEQRDPAELRSWNGRTVTPATAGVLNPAFDVTPARYVTAYIMERGMVQPPFTA
jgi:methylthioribose-1-phosphate isomerase